MRLESRICCRSALHCLVRVMYGMCMAASWAGNQSRRRVRNDIALKVVLGAEGLVFRLDTD